MRHAIILFLLICSAACRAAPKAAILNDGDGTGDLRKLYEQAGYSVALMNEADLADLHAPGVSLFVIPPRSVFPPNGRRHLHRYLTEGGSLAVNAAGDEGGGPGPAGR